MALIDIRGLFALFLGFALTATLFWFVDKADVVPIYLFGVNMAVVAAYVIIIFFIITICLKLNIYTHHRVAYVIGAGVAISLWISTWKG